MGNGFAFHQFEWRGCRPSLLAHPVKDGTQSAYTRCFLEALEELTSDGAEAVTAAALHERIAEKMRAARIGGGKPQTPQLIPAESDITIVPAR